LHAAAFDGQTAVAEVLLAKGADAGARTRGGLTALEVALRQHDDTHPVVELLQRYKPKSEVIAQQLEEKEQSCLVGGDGITSAVAEGKPWPWNDAALKHVGEVNVLFKLRDGEMTTVENRNFPMFALPVLRMEDATPNGTMGSFLTAKNIQAAALHTAPALAEDARELLKEVNRLRRELTTLKGDPIRKFWVEHYPMTRLVDETNKAIKDNSNPEQTKLLQSIVGAVTHMTNRMQASIAPMLGCTPKNLACPDFGVYYRFDPDHFLSNVHLDFPSAAEAEFNDERGVTRDDTWNVWVLLSERVFNHPLAIFDPAVARIPFGFLDPPPKVHENGTAPWRAFTYNGMRQGDAIVWRTTKVPHAGAQWVRSEEDGEMAWEDSEAALQRRESIDIRCTCVPA